MSLYNILVMLDSILDAFKRYCEAFSTQYGVLILMLMCLNSDIYVYLYMCVCTRARVYVLFSFFRPVHSPPVFLTTCLISLVFTVV